MRAAERAYRLLVKLLGRGLGNDYTDEMTSLFLARLAGTRSVLGKARVWLRAGADLLRHGRAKPAARRPSRPPSRSLAGLPADLRSALRLLRRDPAVTLVVVATLAIGIGSVTTLFSLLDGVILRPLPYRDPDRLVLMYEATDEGEPMPVSYPNFADWREQARSFSSITYTFGPLRQILFEPAPPRPVRLLGVGRGFFETLGVQPAAGRWFTDEENAPDAAPVVVVSHALWTGLLGGRAPGADLTISFGDEVDTVVGVTPPGFRFRDDVNIWYPAETHPIRIRAAGNYPVIARLADGVSLERAREEMNTIARRIKQEYPDDSMSASVWMRDLRTAIVGDSRTTLWLLTGAAGLVLLIACANIASTLLARAAFRVQEIAVRRALGAGRLRILRQLMAESLLLALLGGTGGVALAVAAVGWVQGTGHADLPRLAEVSVDLRALGFAGVTAALTTILFGLFPAWRLSGARDGLSGARRSIARGWRSSGWPVLVSAEVALAVVLLVGAALLIHSLTEIFTLDAGYDPDSVLVADITMPTVRFADDDAVLGFYREAERRLADLPGVASVGVISTLPLNPATRRGPVLVLPYEDPEDPDEWDAIAGFRVADAGYFDALGIRLLQGRLFGADDAAGGPGVAVVNASLAEKLWPGENPLGKQVRALWDFQGEDLTVIGVVAEARRWSEQSGGQPALYMPYWQRPTHVRGAYVVVRAQGSPGSLQGPVHSVLEDLDVDYLSSVTTLDAQIADTVGDRAFILSVLGGFAGIALLLSLVGIHGVVAYSVARRRREIGIRVALGATGRSVRWLVQAQVGVAVLAGVVVGGLAAAGATRFMTALLFRVEPGDPVAYAGATTLLVLAAALASYLPARRSTRIDPVAALRAD